MTGRVRVAVLLLALGLIAQETRDVTADVNATTVNAGTLSSTSLYSPTAPAAAPLGRTASLSWTASSPQNGSGYAVSGTNIGSNPATTCPASAASYAFVGGTAATSFTDSTSLSGGTDGTYVCYLVLSGHDIGAPGTWSVDPVWSSADTLPTAKTAIGFFPTSVTMANSGAAGQLNAGDTIVITFDQAVDTASVGAITFVCAAVASSTIYLGITGGVVTCPTAATLGRLTGMTLSSFLSLDGRYAATGAWSNANATLTITVGALSGGWQTASIAAGTETFTAATTITSSTGAVAICSATAICRPTTTTRP
jgi:hypothetical protein